MLLRSWRIFAGIANEKKYLEIKSKSDSVGERLRQEIVAPIIAANGASR